MKALKEHDTEAYYNLLKEHKNEKILNVLTETDKYLRDLGLAVFLPLRPALCLVVRKWGAFSTAADFRSIREGLHPTLYPCKRVILGLDLTFLKHLLSGQGTEEEYVEEVKGRGG